MNPVIRAQVASFKQQIGIENQNDSSIFEMYTIYSVLTGKLGHGVESISAHLRGDEFGLDGIAILIDGELAIDTDEAIPLLADARSPQIDFVFFQSKTGTSFDYGDVSKVFDAIDQFFDGSLGQESTQIADLIEVKKLIYEIAVTKRNPTISIYYATTGIYKAPSRIEKLIQNRVQRLKDLNIFDPESVTVDMLGAEKLQAFYRSATRSVEVKIDFPKQVSMPPNASVEQAYLGFIQASEIVKLVSLKSESGDILGINRYVFFDNVRDFNDKSKLNKSISDTIESEENADFVFRNNGVTVIAKSIARTSDTFTVEDFQIVNGCQTSNIIFNNRDNLNDVSVPFRLIGSNDDKFISSIIVGTNSQNQIKPEQFIALLPFVKNLEEYARSVDEPYRVFIERREHQYQRELIERARIMTLPTLLKALAATLLSQPNRSARDYKKLYNENKDTVFAKEGDVRIYHAIAYLYYRLEFLWRNQRINSSLKIYRFYLLWGIFVSQTGQEEIGPQVRTKDADKFAGRLLALGEDEPGLKKVIKSIENVLNSHANPSKNDSREKLRDAIRADSFAKSVKSDIFKTVQKFLPKE